MQQAALQSGTEVADCVVPVTLLNTPLGPTTSFRYHVSKSKKCEWIVTIAAVMEQWYKGRHGQTERG
jgi:hypothetical protein